MTDLRLPFAVAGTCTYCGAPGVVGRPCRYCLNEATVEPRGTLAKGPAVVTLYPDVVQRGRGRMGIG